MPGPVGGVASSSVNAPWNWAASTEFLNTGDVKFSRNITLPGKLAIGFPLADLNTLQLAVNGGIGARAVYVRAQGLAWPDYVFAPNYALRSLPELATYVQAHHHLPNVPSAAQVASEGMELASLNAALLRQIEELTLYIIRCKKKAKHYVVGWKK